MLTYRDLTGRISANKKIAVLPAIRGEMEKRKYEKDYRWKKLRHLKGKETP